ncbi:MAG: CoA transferase [Chloroflexi bacterium]|nr:CoA transferase [Chloroflexota bacterium]
MTHPLHGIRVLDFSRVLAGPFCTMMLADFGAEVVKFERPDIGDETRHWGPPWAGSLSAYYISINRNKYSITLDLKSAEDRDIARQLARKADVLVENFKVGQMAGFGLDYETLSPENPRLIYCSLTGYGQDGLYANRPGYDYVIQAQSGLMSITGPADGEPHKVGVAIADVISGLNAANAIQAALIQREKTGRGQYIDISLLDTNIAALVNIASNTLISGQASPRLGNAHPNIVPYQTFHAADGKFVLAVGNDRQFAALCDIIGKPEWMQDDRFATNPARVENRDTLIEMLNPILRSQPVAYWEKKLLAHNIPCGPINDMLTALQDPQVAARRLLHDVMLPDGETVTTVGSPIKFSDIPFTIHRPPPELGQDNDEVLSRWLGS